MSPSKPSAWKSTVPALALVFAIGLLLRYPIAAIPLERDEGEYAYMAQRWLMGEVPYRNTFDQKPPGIFAVYVAVLYCVGGSSSAFHWATQVYTLGTLACLYFLGRRLLSPLAGFLAALLGAFLTTDSGVLGNVSNTELFMILPLSAALLTALTASERRSLRWSYLTGLLVAASLLFKQVALYDGMFYLLIIIWEGKRRWRLTGGMVLGILTLLVPCLAYFLAAGAWREFYDCVIGHNLRYAGVVPLLRYPDALWFHRYVFHTSWPIYVLAMLGLVHGLHARRRQPLASASRAVMLLGAWFLVSFLGAMTGGYFLEHYFIQVIPPLCLLGAYGAICVLDSRAVPAWGKNGCAFALTAGAILYGVLAFPWYYLEGTPETKCRKLYGSNPFLESIAVAHFIADHSQPDEPVFVFGSEPQIYYYAARRSASRYIFMYPLTKPLPDTLERQRSLLADLASNPPVLLAVVTTPMSFAAMYGYPSDLFKEMESLEQQCYELVALFPYGSDVPVSSPSAPVAIKVFRRRPHPDIASPR